jgi:inorganic pyrophosphatase
MNKNLLHDISIGKKAPKIFNAIIEIPKGTDNKYEFDKKTGLMKLSRVLYSPVHYPANYGFIPQTLWEDNDPLDVIVVSNHAISSSILVEARPIGVLKMIDQKQHDDKIIAVPIADPEFKNTKLLNDLSEHFLKELKHFFQIYKELENKKVKILKFGTKKEAENSIKKAVKQYNKLKEIDSLK